jgi:RHS repeat-associated protein
LLVVSDRSANSTWYDYIYASSDGTLDSNDLIVGKLAHTTPLAQGANYSASLNLALPTAAADKPYLFVLADGNKEQIETNDNNNSQLAPISTPWTHIAAVLDPTAGMQLYINGKLEATQATNIRRTGTANTRFGSPTNTLDGQLDEVRLWNLARSAEQIQANYQKSLSDNETGLISYWQLDEGVGNTITDKVTGNKNGTLINGTSWGGGSSPVESDNPDIGSQRFTYDPKFNQLTSSIDELGHQIFNEIDPNNGNILSTTQVVGIRGGSDDLVTRYTYTPRGLVDLMTDPEGRITDYDYDALGRLVKETTAKGTIDEAIEQYQYDAAGSPIRTIGYTYDAASQLISTNDPDSRYSYTYDLDGRLTSVDNAGTGGVPNVKLNYSYDAVDNLLSTTDTINGQVKGTVAYTYDALDRATKVTQTGNGVTSKRVDMTYDAASFMTGMTRYADLAGSQLVAGTSYTYDADGRLTKLTHARGGTTLADYNWQYDAANRITQSVSPDGTSNYNYDERDQLLGTDHSYQGDESYSYDANGNRTNAGYNTGDNNQLLSDGKYNYEYDNEGNRTKRIEIATGEVTEYTWDYRNRLTQVVTKGTGGQVIKEAEYTYDVYDRRISKSVDNDGAGANPATVERFVHDGDNLALVFDGNGNQTNRYLYGTGVDEIVADERANGTVIWSLADNQGTVRDLVDNSGNVVNHIGYDSFGNITSQSNPAVDTRFTYTGRELDAESGLYYYRARYYDAAVGGFISEDPIGFGAQDANLYRYVENSPVNLVDPDGYRGFPPLFRPAPPINRPVTIPRPPAYNNYSRPPVGYPVDPLRSPNNPNDLNRPPGSLVPSCVTTPGQSCTPLVQESPEVWVNRMMQRLNPKACPANQRPLERPNASPEETLTTLTEASASGIYPKSSTYSGEQTNANYNFNLEQFTDEQREVLQDKKRAIYRYRDTLVEDPDTKKCFIRELDTHQGGEPGAGYATFVTGSKGDFIILAPDGTFAFFDGLVTKKGRLHKLHGVTTHRSLAEAKSGTTKTMDIKADFLKEVTVTKFTSEATEDLRIATLCNYSYSFVVDDDRLRQRLETKWQNFPRIYYIP